jgi:hypothetical protein
MTTNDPQETGIVKHAGGSEVVIRQDQKKWRLTKALQLIPRVDNRLSQLPEICDVSSHDREVMKFRCSVKECIHGVGWLSFLICACNDPFPASSRSNSNWNPTSETGNRKLGPHPPGLDLLWPRIPSTWKVSILEVSKK